MSMNSSLIEHHSQCCHLVFVTCKINKSATHYNNMASGLLSLTYVLNERPLCRLQLERSKYIVVESS